jgi:hypothetical protein
VVRISESDERIEPVDRPDLPRCPTPSGSDPAGPAPRHVEDARCPRRVGGRAELVQKVSPLRGARAPTWILAAAGMGCGDGTSFRRCHLTKSASWLLNVMAVTPV